MTRHGLLCWMQSNHLTIWNGKRQHSSVIKQIYQLISYVKLYSSDQKERSSSLSEWYQHSCIDWRSDVKEIFMFDLFSLIPHGDLHSIVNENQRLCWESVFHVWSTSLVSDRPIFMKRWHVIIEWHMSYDSFYACIQIQYELETHITCSTASKNDLIWSNTIQSISNKIEPMYAVNDEYLPCSTDCESL
jgi:hypothetical protein